MSLPKHPEVSPSLNQERMDYYKESVKELIGKQTIGSLECPGIQQFLSCLKADLHCQSERLLLNSPG